MRPSRFSYDSTDGTVLQAYKWEAANPRAVLQIAHGAIEHALRYADFAGALVKAGFTVYAADHRGHGATAGTPLQVAYFSDKDGGFMLAVKDIALLINRIQEEKKGLPVFIFGHSMGSSLVRVLAAHDGKALAGVILTGTGRISAPLAALVRFLARCIMAVFGRRHVSPLLHSIVFDTLNRPFKGETGSEFISSNETVVKAYADDPFCGNTGTAEFIYELLGGTRKASKKQTICGFPKNIPLFIGAGEFDSIGGKNLKGLKNDVAALCKAGVHDITLKVYPGMRHEILNEKQKQHVYDDIIEWLNGHIA